jgi:uncharacterized protein (TIGR00251 family)
LEIAVRVTPRAGRTAVTGVRDGILLVRLAAAPVDGAANDALVECLAAFFGRPKRAVSIVAGDRSRHKRVSIEGLDTPEFTSKLSAILPR